MTRARWIFGVVLTAGLVSGVLVYASTSRKKGDIQFESARVDRGRIVARVTATGTLSALVTVQVGSQVSGRILELAADFNTPVTKGQVIARIDPQLIKASVERDPAHSGTRIILKFGRVPASPGKTSTAAAS